jgi:hypothetical protein
LFRTPRFTQSELKRRGADVAALAAADSQHGEFDQAVLPVAFDQLIDRQEALMAALVTAGHPDPAGRFGAKGSEARRARDGIHKRNVTGTNARVESG